MRKGSEAVLPILGRPISPATVSTMAKPLDAVVAAFIRGPLKDQYRVLTFDGVVLAPEEELAEAFGLPSTAQICRSTRGRSAS